VYFFFFNASQDQSSILLVDRVAEFPLLPPFIDPSEAKVFIDPSFVHFVGWKVPPAARVRCSTSRESFIYINYNLSQKMTSGPTYTLASNGSSGGRNSFRTKQTKQTKRHHHRRNNSDGDEDPTDGQGSLTYSATSSVQSGGSAAGESTDSSFADIMRVLDLDEGSSKEMQALLKKEGVSSAVELREKRGYNTSAVSVASSLNYSTDGESHLEGSQLLQTIAG
jgi:hypothetical protein